MLVNKRVNKNKPVNLDLSSLSYPPMAIASILHRISGIMLFLLLPFMLYLLAQSLESPKTFTQLQLNIAGNIGYKWAIWVFMASLTYHLLAGIRHMIMDLGWGESLSAGRKSALLVILLSIVLAVFEGIWLW